MPQTQSPSITVTFQINISHSLIVFSYGKAKCIMPFNKNKWILNLSWHF